MLLILATLALSVVPFAIETAAQSSGTIVPLYIWPSSPDSWQPLIDAKKANPAVIVWAIVNPSNGPGDNVSPEYTSSIKKLISNGINVLGYVRTDYTKRPAGDVRADIDKWVRFYPKDVTGIFFDEMEFRSKKKACGKSNSASSYYKELNDYAKNQTGMKFTVGNPGTDTAPEYVNTVDTIIIYETDQGFPSESQYAGWHTNYPRSTWGILPYNIPNYDDAQVKKAKKAVKYIFVTHDKLPNPWDELPPYLNKLFQSLKD